MISQRRDGKYPHIITHPKFNDGSIDCVFDNSNNFIDNDIIKKTKQK